MPHCKQAGTKQLTDDAERFAFIELLLQAEAKVGRSVGCSGGSSRGSRLCSIGCFGVVVRYVFPSSTAPEHGGAVSRSAAFRSQKLCLECSCYDSRCGCCDDENNFATA